MQFYPSKVIHIQSFIRGKAPNETYAFPSKAWKGKSGGISKAALAALLSYRGLSKVASRHFTYYRGSAPIKAPKIAPNKT